MALQRDTILIPSTGSIINDAPKIITSDGRILNIEGFDANQIRTDKSAVQGVRDFISQAEQSGQNVQFADFNEISDFESQILKQAASTATKNTDATAALQAQRGSISLENVLSGNFSQALPSIQPTQTPEDLSRSQAGREQLRAQGVNPDLAQTQPQTGQLPTVPTAPVAPAAPAVPGQVQATQAGAAPAGEQDPLEQIRAVFGPDFQPAPIFQERGLTDDGFFGAVRVTDSADPNKVTLLGPRGGLQINDPTDFQNRFGTLNQEGIVGEIDSKQAQQLGIAIPGEAKIGAGVPGDPVRFASEAVGGTTDGVSPEAEQATFEQEVSSTLDSHGVAPPDSQQSPFTAFAQTYQDLYESLGLPDIQSQFDTVNAEFAKVQDELNDKIADINENPWLTEGVRVNRIRALEKRFEGKLSNLNGQLSIFDNLYQQGRQDAQFIATQAMTISHQNQVLDQQLALAAIDQSEKASAAKAKLSQQEFENLLDIEKLGLSERKFETDVALRARGLDIQATNAATARFNANKASDPKQPTQSQFLAAGFGARAQQAGSILDGLTPGIMELHPAQFAAFLALPINALKPTEIQELEQAQRNWINAVLRRESGAAIAPSEFENAEQQYFPQPGDKEQVLINKKANRLLVENSLINEAGTAFVPTVELFNNPGATNLDVLAPMIQEANQSNLDPTVILNQMRNTDPTGVGVQIDEALRDGIDPETILNFINNR